MVKFALLAKLKAKSGKESEVEEFLKSAVPMVEAETGTKTWYAIKFDDSTFGIFDTFDDEEGRDAHLNGKVAAALMAKADELFSESPDIKKLDVLAEK
ncbi:MAG: putative quinol monooxygenase [Pyrinomonadaceae bacterium]